MRDEFFGLDLFEAAFMPESICSVTPMPSLYEPHTRVEGSQKRNPLPLVPSRFRTGKAGVYRNLPHLLTEAFFKIIGKIIIEFIAHLYIFLRQEALAGHPSVDFDIALGKQLRSRGHPLTLYF